MIEAVLVGAGGVAGAVARHVVDRRLDASAVATLVVNVLGSTALGAVLAAPVGEAAVLVVGTGFCGAFTTFSSFAVETVTLAEAGAGRRAAGYALGTLAAALVGVAVGAGAATALGALVG